MNTIQKIIRPLVICGPSGSGKSTILNQLFQNHKDCFAFSISHTTRQPRAGETNGENYHFTDRDTMQSMITSGDFLEHTEFAGNFYGTSLKAVQDVLKSGRICVLDIDVEGVKSVKNYVAQQKRSSDASSSSEFNPRFVFVRPPSLEVLEVRLRGRGTEQEDKIQARLARSSQEIAFSQQSGVFDLIVLNDELERAVAQIEGYLSEDLFAVKNRLINAAK